MTAVRQTAAYRYAAAILATTAALVALIGLASPVRAGTLAKPNIIYIMLDDAGYGDIGSYEDGNFVLTPEMDQLATEGLRFTQHYVNAPVCSPSRAAILTGKYPVTFGIRRAVVPESHRGLPTDVATMANVLATPGFDYVSGFFGKWHVGDVQPQHLPNAHGFTESAIYQRGEEINYFDPQFLENDTTPVIKPGHMTEIITDYALDFIEDHKTESFLLCVWFVAPHFPLQPPTNWQQNWPYADNANGHYAALVSDADAQLGRILSRLDTLGLTSTSVVIATSDNGSPRDQMGSNGRSRGQKTEMFEGGIRAPLIVRWPGVVPAGTTTDSLSTAFDFIPTIAGGLGIPHNAADFDGQDLSSVFAGGPPVSRSSTLFWETKDETTRTFPSNEELHAYAVRNGDWKLVRENNLANFDPFLFDIRNDPREEIDLYAEFPDVAASLEREYRQWRQQVSQFDVGVDSTVGNVTVVGDTFTFDDGYAILEDDSRFAIDDADFTFRAKITPTDLSPPGNQFLIQKIDSFRLFIRPGDTLRLVVRPGDVLESNATLDGSTVLQNDIEYDVAITVFGFRFSNAIIRIYIDGQLEATNETISSIGYGPNPVTLGGSLTSSSSFIGEIRDPEFHASSLSAAELYDSDSDGLVDSVDNCNAIANVSQSDFDGDAMGDSCDTDDDNDGLADTVETNSGFFTSATDTGTNPLNADSDGDGSEDGIEVLDGYDPNEWDSRDPTYVTRSVFESRLLNRTGLTDFDAIQSGQTLSNSTVLVSGIQSTDVSFPNVDDVVGSGGTIDLMVVEDLGNNLTTSGLQSLGTDDIGNYDTLIAGTEIQFTFPEPTQGFGLTIVSPDQRFSAILDQDIHLEVPGIGTAMLDIREGEYLGTDDGLDYYGYFLGVIGVDNETFTQATLRYDASVTAGSFLFNVDDLVSVPEPQSLCLLAAGLVGLRLMKRHRIRHQRKRLESYEG